MAAGLDLRDLKKRRTACEGLVFGCLFLLEVVESYWWTKVWIIGDSAWQYLPMYIAVRIRTVLSSIFRCRRFSRSLVERRAI